MSHRRPFAIVLYLLAAELAQTLGASAGTAADDYQRQPIRSLRLVIHTSTWMAMAPPDVRALIAERLASQQVRVVSPGEASTDGTLRIDYRETKRSSFGPRGWPVLTGSSGTGTNISCSIELVHPQIGSVHTQELSVSTSETVYGIPSSGVSASGSVADSFLRDDAVRNFQTAMSRDFDFRVFQIKLAAKVGAVAYLASLLKGKAGDADLRSTAVEGLKAVGDGPAAEALLAVVRDADEEPRVKDAAMLAIPIIVARQLEPSRAMLLQRLLGALNDASAFVRLRVVKILAAVRDRRALESLRQVAAADPDEDIRYAAELAVKELR